MQYQAKGDMTSESNAQSENDPFSRPDRFCGLFHITHPPFHPPTLSRPRPTLCPWALPRQALFPFIGW